MSCGTPCCRPACCYDSDVAQTLPDGWLLDPEDPRAPSVEQWERMLPEERARVVAMLPIEVPLDLLPNEGDPHRKATRGALDALDGYFQRIGRKIYLSSQISVYYPAERRFAPDVLAVTDVDPHERNSWVVSDEGKGLDFVLEVHVAGDRRKDEKTNVERYARLKPAPSGAELSRRSRPPAAPATPRRGAAGRPRCRRACRPGRAGPSRAPSSPWWRSRTRSTGPSRR